MSKAKGENKVQSYTQCHYLTPCNANQGQDYFHRLYIFLSRENVNLLKTYIIFERMSIFKVQFCKSS